MLSIEIAKVLGLTGASAGEATRELHRAGKIHIANWRHGRRNQGTKIFAFGKGRDAPKPVRAEKPPAEPFIPHADVAADWLRNSI